MLYKKPNSKFWITKFELTHNGVRKRFNKSTKKTKKSEAEKVELAFKQQAWDQLISPEKVQYNCSDALPIYLQSKQSNRTLAEKKTKLEWWVKKLHDCSLKAITSQTLLSILSHKQGIAVATRNRYLAEIKAFLNFCYRDLEWIDKVPNIRLIKEPPRDFYKLDSNDIKRLLHASPDYLKPVILFALFTGLRRSNILNLCWRNIDFAEGLVFISSSEHKSKSSVATPLSDDAIRLLKAIYHNSSAYVFLNSRNNPIQDIKDYMWKRIVKKAGLEGFRFHDLRHNWCHQHLNAQTPLMALKELGGWKTLEMVQRYAHPNESYLKAHVNNVHVKQVIQDEINALTILTKDVTKNSVSKKGKKSECGKKSSHFEVVTEDYVIIGEPQKLKNLLKISRLIMVPEAGLEPARPQRQRILNPSCLPIPPLRQHVLNVSLMIGIIKKKTGCASVFMVQKV